MEAAKAYDKWAMTIPDKPLNFPADAPKRQLSELRTQTKQKVEDALFARKYRVFPGHRNAERRGFGMMRSFGRPGKNSSRDNTGRFDQFIGKEELDWRESMFVYFSSMRNACSFVVDDMASFVHLCPYL